MLWNNFKIATALYFGWLIVDSAFSIFLGTPIDGVYYPVASGKAPYSLHDWTGRSCFEAPLYLFLISIVWLFVIRKEGLFKGMRLAALFTSFIVAPSWIVTSASASISELNINMYWLLSMIYVNLSFLLFVFLGNGNINEMNF